MENCETYKLPCCGHLYTNDRYNDIKDQILMVLKIERKTQIYLWYVTPSKQIQARRKHCELRKLQTQLANEKTLRDDLEAQLVQKNALLQDQTSKLEYLRHEGERRRQLQGELQAVQDIQEDLSKEQESNQGLRRRLGELEGYRKENGRLQEVIDRMSEEMGQMKSMVSGGRIIIIITNIYRAPYLYRWYNPKRKYENTGT